MGGTFPLTKTRSLRRNVTFEILRSWEADVCNWRPPSRLAGRPIVTSQALYCQTFRDILPDSFGFRQRVVHSGQVYSVSTV